MTLTLTFLELCLYFHENFKMQRKICIYISFTIFKIYYNDGIILMMMMSRYYGGVGIAVSREEDLRRERAREREERDKMVRDYIR